MIECNFCNSDLATGEAYFIEMPEILRELKGKLLSAEPGYPINLGTLAAARGQLYCRMCAEQAYYMAQAFKPSLWERLTGIPSLSDDWFSAADFADWMSKAICITIRKQTNNCKVPVDDWLNMCRKRGDKAREKLEVGYPTTDVLREEKRQFADKHLKSQPAAIRELCERAVQLEYMGDFNGALSAFLQAVKLDPSVPTTHYDMGNLFSRLKRPDEAISSYSQCIDLDSRFAWAYCNRGVIYFDEGMYQEALEDFKQAVELNPKDGMSYVNMGRTYWKLGQQPEAQRAFEAAVEADPSMISLVRQVRRELGELKEIGLSGTGRPSPATRIAPKDLDFHLDRVVADISSGHYQAAIVHCEEVLKLDPRHGHARDLIAEAKVKNALQIDPHDVYAEDLRFGEIALEGARVALRDLGPFGQDSVPALMLLVKDEDERVRWLVNEILRDIGPDAKDAIPLLIEALKDPYGYVRGSAAIALSQIRQSTLQVISALTESLQDSDSFVRNAAVGALQRLGPAAKVALPALYRIQGHDPDYRVRETAEMALALISSDDWRTHLEASASFFDFGQMADAQSECEISRQLAQKAGSLLGEAHSLIQRGRCKVAQGSLEKALHDLQQGHEKAEISGDTNARANALDALGICYRDMGQLSQAIAHFKHALEICQAVAPFGSEGVCNVSANLARTFLYRNGVGGEDLAKAEEVLLKAASSVGIRPIQSLRVWQNLALLYIQKRDLEKAVDYLEYSLLLKRAELEHRLPDHKPPDVKQLGKIRRTVSDLLPIIDYLQQELQVALHSQDIHAKISCYFYKAQAHMELASRLLQERRGDFVQDYDVHRKQAYESYRDGINLLERELRARLRKPESRLTFLEHRLDAYEQMVLLCRDLGRHDEALEYAERSRSRVFLDQLAMTAIQMPRNEVAEDVTLRQAVPARFKEVIACLQTA